MSMAETTIRPATRADLPRLTDIYNHYVINTPITFDLEPLTVAARTPWFEEHSESGRYRLLVAVEDGKVIGYASTGRFRVKHAYDPTVDSSIYCAPEGTGRRIGSKLYTALFDAIAGEDINRIVAGVTIPNDASIALHQRFGFRVVGTFTEIGRKLGRFWDVTQLERPLKIAT
jgi:phosphinothricin acetyltransferase